MLLSLPRTMRYQVTLFLNCPDSIYFCLPCLLVHVYMCNNVIILPTLLQIGSHIKKQVTELGNSCTGLVTKAGALQCSPNDSITKKELIDAARKVSEKVSEVFPYSLVRHQIAVVGCLRVNQT